jgi:hypothetical protein
VLLVAAAIVLLGLGDRTSVIVQGEAGDAYYIVSSGRADVVHDGARIAEVVAGDGFGEIALLDDRPRTASIVVREALEGYRLADRLAGNRPRLVGWNGGTCGATTSAQPALEHVVPSLSLALVAGSIVLYAVACVDPAVRAEGGRFRARLAVLGISAAVVALLGASAFLGPPFAVAGFGVAVFILLVPAGWIVRGTGGPEWTAAQIVVREGVARAYQRLGYGDPDGWRQEMMLIERPPDPALGEYVASLHEMARELERGAPPQPSTSQRLGAAYGRAFVGDGLRRPLAAALILLAVVGAAGPAFAAERARAGACDDALAIVDRIKPEVISGASRLENLVPRHPGIIGAVALFRDRLDLVAAVESRVDPRTEAQLIEAGFVEGLRRGWEAEIGVIAADAFEFDSPEGALRFHRDVTAYACSFAERTFPVGDNAVGMRINYRSEPHIRDQIAWIDGRHRVLVSIGYTDVPFDTSDIKRLYSVVRGPTE